ncbi:hypothetical protein [Luteimonas fraxinea]|uniref:hypothetical protein n=1 Tax=Luteimonas fraxinea TaxID=2901869 RepID=UPI001E4C13CA|nr:hypothetical protein [Luteimonas fraxinea]MCD9126009.1 hypothetical protein [Luteimonas fraxinea]
MQKSKIAVALSVVVIGGACAWAFAQRDEASMDPVAVAASPATLQAGIQQGAREQGLAVAAGASLGYRDAAPGAPLPPENAPLNESFEQLKLAADAGNPRAACRLGFELQRCESREGHEIFVSNSISSAEMSRNERELDATAKMAESAAIELEGIAGVCKDFDRRDVRSWDYLLQAARAGHVPSMVRISAEPPLDGFDMANDFEKWKVFSDEAEGFLKSAYQQGSAEAAYVLFAYYAGMPAGVSLELVEPDPAQAFRYGSVAMEFADAASSREISAHLDALSSKLSAEQRAQADRLARTEINSLFQRTTRSAPLVQDTTLAGLSRC